MKQCYGGNNAQIVVATPGHAAMSEPVALALCRQRLLRFVAMGTRRGVAGVPAELTRLNPAIGLLTYATARTLPTYQAESFRFRLHPWFDHWVKRQLRPGDHIYSSYGYANASFRWVRRHGGQTILEAGNSHPEYFHTLLGEEHRRWGSPRPPVADHHYRRSVEMMEHVDYVMSPSSFVTNSFLAHGFKPAQIFKCRYPIDVSCFTPSPSPRPANRPLRVICTGMLSLRKGAPYLLEAFRLVNQKIPAAQLLLTRSAFEDIKPILAKYNDLPIDWAPSLPHPQLAERLRSADIFVLPSLEDGLAFTVIEALACGLPAITTPNTGASDLIQPGRNGEVVPIRDAKAIADAVLKWAEKILASDWQPRVLVDQELVSFDHFEREFDAQLRRLNLAGPA
jgi:glycosyltransferase involved in cell wall biosynthesis